MSLPCLSELGPPCFNSSGQRCSLNCYVDSPLTVQITDVFKLHPECYDEDTRKHLLGADSPFDFSALRYISDREASKALSSGSESCVIISASGMCEGGRIVHHLRSSIESDRNTIMIVGFQAQHTLGRRLVEGRSRVKIFGVERDVRAQVKVMNGFSAHADQNDLTGYMREARNRGPLQNVIMVHGEPKAMASLEGRLRAPTTTSAASGIGFQGKIWKPLPGDRIEI
jgi:metallo-beta-lactamase family protein